MVAVIKRLFCRIFFCDHKPLTPDHVFVPDLSTLTPNQILLAFEISASMRCTRCGRFYPKSFWWFRQFHATMSADEIDSVFLLFEKELKIEILTTSDRFPTEVKPKNNQDKNK